MRISAKGGCSAIGEIVGCSPAELGQIVAAEIPGIRGMELFEPDLETEAWTGPEVIIVGLTPVSDSTLDR